jgi:hypothetical protein
VDGFCSGLFDERFKGLQDACVESITISGSEVSGRGRKGDAVCVAGASTMPVMVVGEDNDVWGNELGFTLAAFDGG